MLGSLASAAGAQPSEEAKEEIVITGSRIDPGRIKIMLDFVTELGDPVNRDFGFARLEEHACFRVHNTTKAVAEYLQQRMGAIAAAVKLQAQRVNCKPNVDVIFSEDARKIATELVTTRKALFNPFRNAEGTMQDSHALAAFKNSEVAVRWWQITVPVDRAGNPVVPSADPGEPPYVAGANSFLASGMRDRLLGTLIIVDTTKLGDATWDQLADYLAMVALVQVDPNASLAGFDTILNLFSGNAVPASLTQWDRAYLEALYDMNLFMLPHVQRANLANRLMRNLDKASE